jgi:hypothetical protein
MIVAVGPTAHAALDMGHPDLALIDEVRPAAAVCMFDSRDETWWARAVQRVRDLPRPRWFVVAIDSLPRSTLRCLARDLDACVVAARPTELLRAALLPLAGLVRPGVIGCDLPSLAQACASPSIAVASFDLDDHHHADSVLLVFRDPRLSLAEMNEVCGRLVNRYQPADIVVTAPLFERPLTGNEMAIGYLAIERLSPSG